MHSSSVALWNLLANCWLKQWLLIYCTIIFCHFARILYPVNKVTYGCISVQVAIYGRWKLDHRLLWIVRIIRFHMLFEALVKYFALNKYTVLSSVIFCGINRSGSLRGRNTKVIIYCYGIFCPQCGKVTGGVSSSKPVKYTPPIIIIRYKIRIIFCIPEIHRQPLCKLGVMMFPLRVLQY